MLVSELDTILVILIFVSLGIGFIRNYLIYLKYNKINYNYSLTYIWIILLVIYYWGFSI